MTPFTRRALELMADYDTRFNELPKFWSTQIQKNSNPFTQAMFAALEDSMISDAIVDLGPELDDEEFTKKLGRPGEADKKVSKALHDLGLWDQLNMLCVSYFAARRNILDDQRCWVRLVQIVDEEVDAWAC